MKDELVYIPIERVEFIRDGVDGLRSFLATGNWRDPNWHRAVLLHRADAGGWYVFSNIEFRAFATTADRIGLGALELIPLKQLFRIRESMKVDCLQSGDVPKGPSVVIEGERPRAIWVRSDQSREPQQEQQQQS